MNQPSRDELGYIPEVVYPPGATVDDVLDDEGMTRGELAGLVRFSDGEMDNLLIGAAPLTDVDADRIAAVLGISARLLVNLERSYVEHLERTGAQRPPARQLDSPGAAALPRLTVRAVDQPAPEEPAAGPPPCAESVLAQMVARVGGATRYPQNDMARMTEGSLTGAEASVVVEAGTGSGKSFAYLSGGGCFARQPGRRVVVSTYTKALQGQVEDHDLPTAASIAGFTPAVLRGLSNYVCRQKLAEAAGTLEAPEAARVGAAAQATNGEIAEIDGGERWTVNHDECPGRSRCPEGEKCWAMLARDRAQSADMVIANHALLGYDHEFGGMLLGAYDGLIVDECHRLEEALLNCQQIELTPGRVHYLANAAAKVLGSTFGDAGRAAAKKLADLLDEMHETPARSAKLMESGADWLADERGEKARSFTQSVWEDTYLLADDYYDYDYDPDGSNHGGPDPYAAAKPAARLHRLADRLRSDMLKLSPASRDDYAIQHTTRSGKQAGVVRRPVLVSPRTAAIWRVPHVLCSATVPSGIEAQLRLPEATAIRDLGSPLDYSTAAVLYHSETCPAWDREKGEWSPREDAWEEMRALMEAAGGRTLALFNDFKSMSAAAKWIKSKWNKSGTDLGILTQSSDGNIERLMDQFADDPSLCLFGSRTCYEGVDVSGDSLSLVIIEKVPNLPRSDPKVRALEKLGYSYAEQNGPHVTTLLRQGWGRLLRSEADWGVLAIFDDRPNSRQHIHDAATAMVPKGAQMPRCDFYEALDLLEEIRISS